MSTNTYTTLASLPAASSNTGNIALVTSNGVQYISDGQKWKSQGEFTTGTIESLQLDDLSFNGSFTNFALKVGGSNVFPQNTTDVIIVVNGNTLKPGRDFTFIKSSTATNISFTNSDNTPKAYPAGTIFYGLVFSRLPLDSNNALQKSGGTMVGDITFSSNQSFPSSGIDNASTTQSGIVSLSSSTGSTSESVAATSKAVKDAKDAADAAASTANSASSAASSAATTANNALALSGGIMTGNISFNSTQEFDGRDLSVDGTKLDGIATSANNYSISSDLLDEDDMASDSASKVASQQSIKAYVDAHTGATDLSYTASSRELASSTGTNVNLPEATTSAAGLQSSADKTKLDGIETAATADQTGAEIKSAYEGEADTNAFTDADHTKLDGIATGAEVNVNADWNSTSGDSQILNKPTLVSALNDLSDVSAASPSANQIIKWNGSAWALAADGGGSGGGGVSQNLIVTLTESIDGSRTDFTMSTTPATAQNLMVSINGVIQKPNAGTTISNSSEGYCISGSTLKFATAPASGSTVFVVAQTAGSGGSTDLSFDDDAKIKFGTGNDLLIYHDGSSSIIRNYNTSTPLYIQPADSETGIKLIANGSTELYYDNSKKFQTTTNGVYVWGDIDAGDNNKILLGAGDDLQIYHDGSHSRIVDIGTGDLVLQGSHTYLNSTDNSEHKAIFYDNGSVALYYDHSKKLETTSGGAKWTGDLTCDDNNKIRIGSSGDLNIYHDGSDNRIQNAVANQNIYIEGYPNEPSTPFIYLNPRRNITGLSVKANQGVDLYYDGVKKLETHASNGVVFPAGLQAPDTQALRLGSSNDLLLYHDGSNSFILNATGELQIANSGNGAAIFLQAKAGENCVRGLANGAAELYFDSSKKLETLSTGAKVTGRFHVGTSSALINETSMSVAAAGNSAVFKATGATGHNPIICWNNATSGDRSQIQFGDGTSFSAHGTITTNGANVTYGGTSDYRLKQDEVLITDGIEKIKQLLPKRFKWKNNLDLGICDGFFAHEVQETIPTAQAVVGTKDAVDSDGNAIHQQIDHAKLIPILTAALKESISKIETLETKVAALEGA